MLKLSHICRILDIQSFSSQWHEIIIDYLLILAKVTPKQYSGAILTSKWFENAISKLLVCEMRAHSVLNPEFIWGYRLLVLL